LLASLAAQRENHHDQETQGKPHKMLSIRSATANDAALLKTLIHEMADYERDAATITERDLLRDGFGPQPKFRVLLAECDGQPAGYALFYDCYLSFRGPGIFLEDIYVRSAFRGKNIGRALFARVAAIARDGNCASVLFNVMDWNEPAIQFYKRLNVTFLDDWKTLCLQGTALQDLAKETQ
jgi:GNAT superfamily N-acetyltransferase